MNRIAIGNRVYDLGKVVRSKMTEQQWAESKVNFRRNDRAHVVKIDGQLFYVLEATLDPKLKQVNLYYRPMSLIYVRPKDKTRSEDEDQFAALSLRAIRRGEL